MVIPVNSQTAGFSLIEVMVVVAVMSILAIGATLSVTRGGTATDSAAATLRSDATQARHLAMQSGLDHALIFEETGWQVARRSGTAWTHLRTANPRGLRVANPSQGQLVLGADGRVGALDITFGTKGAERRCTTSDGALPRCR